MKVKSGREGGKRFQTQTKTNPRAGSRRFKTLILLQDFLHSLHYSLNIRVGCSPVTHAHSHGAMAAPGRALKKCFARFEDRCNHFVRSPVMIFVCSTG